MNFLLYRKMFLEKLKFSLFFSRLYLNGYSMPIQKLNLDDLTNSREDFTFLEEEIIEQEGEYEELLAYDNQEEEYLFEHNKRLNLNKRRKHGLPPITPKASMKDLVTNFLFDHMWSELIDWSMDLIKEYAKTVLDNGILLYFFSKSLKKTIRFFGIAAYIFSKIIEKIKQI